MKICMLAPEFFPVWGGVGTYTVGLIRNLPQKIEVHVIAPWRRRIGVKKLSTKDYELSEYFEGNVHVHFISNASDIFFSNAQFQYACFKHVPRILKEENIDLVHSHTANMPDLLLRFRDVKTPILTTIHTTLRGQRSGTRASGANYSSLDSSEKAIFFSYPILRLIENVYFKCNRHYITVSKWMRTQLEQQYPEQGFSSIPVIYNSIDTTRFAPSQNPDQNRFDSNTVLFTGRLIAAKGATDIIKAIPKVLQMNPEARFVFIGPGDPAIYQRMLAQRGVSDKSYMFLGYLKNVSDLIKYYQSCGVYLAPTLYENLPIRILEAMSCEAPVVATNICGIPEMITSGKNGVLIPPRSPKELTSSICSLLEDSKLRRNLGRTARKRVEKAFSWKPNIAKMVKVYETILEHFPKL